MSYEKPNMTYMFQLNPENKKMKIYIDISSDPEQQIISDQIKKHLIPLLDSLLLSKKVVLDSNERDFYAREFKVILEAMIEQKLINDHHFNIWHNGHKI